MTPDVLHAHTRRKKISIGIVKANGLSFQQEKKTCARLLNNGQSIGMVCTHGEVTSRC